MPVVKVSEQNPLVDGRQSETALMIQRGMIRYLENLGNAVLSEFPLANGRRADLLALDKKGFFTVIEIKSSIEDFRVDQKWPEYASYCDRFAFATSRSVPEEIFPDAEGLYIADNYDAAMVRHSAESRLAPASRKALTLRFARIAAQRMERINRYASRNGYQLPETNDVD